MSDAYSLEQLRDCARRELVLRQRVYRRWVEQGRYTLHQARLEIEMMEAIIAHFTELIERDDRALPLEG
jgi:hypothetical protein